MGLNERRILQQIKEETERSEKELQNKIGLNISLTIDGSSFPMNDEKVLNDFFIRKIYGLTSVLDAMIAICDDDIGKETVYDSIKSIQLVNTAKHYEDEGSKEVKLKNGKLQIFCAFNKTSDNLYKPEHLRKEIERML